MPIRSHFYHLEPIGLGTSSVEALTSYFMRLSIAHCVPPLLMIKNIFSKDNKRFRVKAIVDRVNGANTTARYWIANLESLTLKTNLRYLTLLPLSNLLEGRKTYSKNLIWCPLCYSEWQATEKPFYQPLLWSINLTKVCLSHKIQLCDRCQSPNCSKPIPLRSIVAFTGHCPWCHFSLAEIPEKGNTQLQNDYLNSEIDRAAILGEILSISSETEYISLRQVILTKLIDSMIVRNDYKSEWLYSQIGYSSNDLTKIISLKQPLQIDLIVNSLKLLGTSICVKENKSLSYKSDNELLSALLSLSKSLLYKTELSLKSILSETPSPKLAQVARRLNCDVRFLKRNFPTETKQIVTNAIITDSKIGDVLNRALIEIPPPNLNIVSKRVRRTAKYLQVNYPYESQQLIEKVQTYELGEESHTLKSEQLQKLLLEVPTPSLITVSKRIGLSYNNLKILFPFECQQFLDKSKLYLQQSKQVSENVDVKGFNSNIEYKPNILDSKTSFPDEYKQILGRAKTKHNYDEIREILKKASFETSTHNLSLLSQRIGCSFNFLQKNFSLEVKEIYDKEKQRISQLLQEALVETPSPSLRTVIKRTNRSYKFVKDKFPEETRKIVERNTIEDSKTTELLQKALSESPVPSLRQVVKRVHRSQEYIRRNFPEERKQILIQSKIDYEEVGKILRAAIAEVPPPTLVEVFPRIKLNPQGVRKRFPEEVSQIVKNNKEFKEKQIENIVQERIVQVVEIMRSLASQDLYPSRNRIQSSINIDVGNNSILKTVWKKTLRELYP